MADIDLVFAVAGAGALLAAALPGMIKRLPLSLPVLFLATGLVLYWLPLPLPEPDPIEYRGALEHLTEVTLIVTLMGAGLALNRPFRLGSWSTTWRLVAVVLPLSVLLVGGLAYALLALPVAAAALLGAALAPTDPVLAADVRVGEPADDPEYDDDEVRFALTSEAGLNDGLAFPFVFVAIALAGTTGMVELLAVDFLYKTVGGVAVGLAMGWALGRLFFGAGRAPLRLAERSEGFVALAATLLTYGVAELAHTYGFIAVFTTACAIRSAEHSHGYHTILHGFIEQVERLFTAWLLLLVGGYIATGGLSALTWQGAAVGLIALLVIRPLLSWAAMLGAPPGKRERRVIAFFGVRGVGSLFYVAYALGHADFKIRPESIWAVVTFTVLASACLHGATSTPVLRWIDRIRRRRTPNPGV